MVAKQHSMSEVDELFRRPGFLVRRLHQIHLALFIEECAGLDITPVQYSVMTVVAAQPEVEQGRVGYEVGVDRATLAKVVARLEARDLLRRKRSRGDRRLKLVELTAKGRALLRQVDGPALRAHARTIEALPPKQRALFLADLRRLVEAGNDYGRAPLRLG